MLFTCVPDIWQVLESNQNCSDNNKTEQPLTTTISPDPISDPIGAVLNYLGLLPPDISDAGCAGDVPAATQATAHTQMTRFEPSISCGLRRRANHTQVAAERTSTSNSAISSFSLNGCQYAEPDRKLDQTNQIQRLDATETEAQTTQDRTTQDLTAPIGRSMISF